MSDDMPEGLAKALEQAQYNEFVRMSVADEHGNKHDFCLFACLDEKNGGIHWNNSNEMSNFDPTVQFFKTKRWVFPMLNDTTRNEMYQKAIQCAVESLRDRASSSSNDFIERTWHVLDIGSGTGLLGMLAARSFQNTLKKDRVQVVSIEMAEEMASVARRTIQDNQLSDVISVVEGHSCELPPLSQKANLCVSELLESGLLGEGILPAVRDAWERHLQDDAIMIPQRARVYAQLLGCNPMEETNWMENFHGPHNQTIAKSFKSSDRRPLRWSLDSNEGSLLLDARQVQMPVHAKKLFDSNEMIALTEAVPVFAFDFTSRDAAMIGIDGRRQSTAFSVTSPGTISGVLLWWELDLWDDITYSCEPGKQPFQDHWQQCLQVLSRRDHLDVVPGDTISLEFSHNDQRVFVEAIWKGLEGEVETKDVRMSDEDSALISPFRAYLLNDNTRLNAFKSALENALSRHANGKAAKILDLSDGGWGACLAGVLGATNIISVESSSNKQAKMAARIAQCGNGLPTSGDDGATANFDLILGHSENLSVNDLWGQSPDIIIADYYHMFEGWNLQESLNFYYKCRALQRKKVLSDQTIFLSGSFRLMACVIESEQLRSAYSSCGDHHGRILGLDHSYLNTLAGNFSAYDLSIPLFWQYEYKDLSDPFEIDSFEMGSNPGMDGTRIGNMKDFKRAGTMDAIVLWIEYDFPGTDLSLSTGQKPYNQMVRMLPNPKNRLSESDVEEVVICIDFFCGGLASPLTHDFDISFARLAPA